VHSLVELKGPQGRIPVVGTPSASAVAPGRNDSAGYNLYRIDGGRGGWRCEAIWRGLAADGGEIVELKRLMLIN
jgi:hypothetical protein